MGLRFEAWTPPWSATFERVVADLPVPVGAARGSLPLSDFGEGQIVVPWDYDRISELISETTGRLIRVYDGTDIIQEFLCERTPRPLLDRRATAISGPDLASAAFDAAFVYPWDYPADPPKFLDHVYGSRNLISNPSGTDNILNEKQRIHIDGVFRSTPLSGAIDASQTSITVDDATVYFASTPFSIRIDSEQLRVTNVVSNTLTVTRGYAGTTAAAHTDDTLVHEVPSDSFTLTFDGETTSAINWNPHAGDKATFHTTASAIDAALVALTNIITVAVEVEEFYDSRGTFDHADIWVEFIDPGEQAVALMTATTPTSCQPTTVTRESQGGAGDPHPWTVSRNPNTGLVHGGETVIRASDTALGEPADCIVVIPTARYGGGQIVLDVPPGALAQGSLEVQPTVEGEFRFVLRDLNEKFIAADPGESTGTTLSTGSFTEMSLTDVQIPATTTKIIVRIATVDTDEAAWAKFYIRNATFEIGYGPATVGRILQDLLDDAAVDHAADTRGTILDWIDYTSFSATLDSGGNAWPREESITISRGMWYGQVFDRLGRLGYEWELRPKATPSGGKTHDLHVYAPEGRQTDHTTAATPALNVGQSVIDGELVQRIPAYTAVMVEGAGNRIVEDSDPTAVTNFGRRERYVGDRSLASTVSLQAVADEQLDAEQRNRDAVHAVVVASPDHPRPLVAYRPGDKLWFQFPPAMAKKAKRVRQITWQNTEPAIYEITGSRFFPGQDAAYEALRRMLRKFTPLDDNRGGTAIEGATPAPAPPQGGTSSGAYIHLSRAATQTIPVGGTPIEFDTLGALGHAGFTSPTPGTETRIPVAGYWDVNIATAWDTWRKGGSVWVTRTRNGAEVTVWPASISDEAAASAGRRFVDLAADIPCEPGDILRVYVDADDASAQTLAWAACSFRLVDRVGTAALTSLQHTETLHDTATTSHELTLPPTANGDRIILLFHGTKPGGGPVNVTDWGGFTELSEVLLESGSDEGSWVAHKEADGSETTVTVTTNTTLTSAMMAIVVPQGGTPEVGSTSGNSLTPDPPSKTHSSGGPRFIAIASYSTDGPDSAPARQTTAHPDIYTMVATVASGVGGSDGATIGAAFREAQSATEDPTAFAYDGDSDRWVAHTILVPYTGAVS